MKPWYTKIMKYILKIVTISLVLVGCANTAINLSTEANHAAPVNTVIRSAPVEAATITGAIKHNVTRRKMDCPKDVTPCDPIGSVSVELQEAGEDTSMSLFIKKDETYVEIKCAINDILRGEYDCGEYEEGEEFTIEGTYITTREPTAWKDSRPSEFRDTRIFVLN